METRRSATKKWVPKQPLDFAKRLVSQDKRTRVVALETIQNWLANCNDQIGLEYGRLWHGLFFCMWIDSSSVIQEELAVAFGRLVHLVQEKCRMTWLEQFWSKMQEGWDRLNLHHMSRFLQLLSNVVEEAFRALRISGWHSMQARMLSNLFTKYVPMGHNSVQVEQQSQALFLHYVRIFWSALQPHLRPASPVASTAVLLELLEPFCSLAEKCHNQDILHALHRRVFRIAPVYLCEALVARISVVCSKKTTLSDSRWLCDVTTSKLQLRLASENQNLACTGKSNGIGMEDPLPREQWVRPGLQKDGVILLYLQGPETMARLQRAAPCGSILKRRKIKSKIKKRDSICANSGIAALPDTVACTEALPARRLKKKKTKRGTPEEPISAVKLDTVACTEGLPARILKKKKTKRRSTPEEPISAEKLDTVACTEGPPARRLKKKKPKRCSTLEEPISAVKRRKRVRNTLLNNKTFLVEGHSLTQGSSGKLKKRKAKTQSTTHVVANASRKKVKRRICRKNILTNG